MYLEYTVDNNPTSTGHKCYSSFKKMVNLFPVHMNDDLFVNLV